MTAADAQTSRPERPDFPKEVVLGYSEPLVAHAGDRVDLHVSTDAAAYEAELLRLRSAGGRDGLVAEPVPSLELPALIEGRACRSTFGSWVEVGPAREIAALTRFRASIWVFPTLLTAVPQVAMGTMDGSDVSGWQVCIDVHRGVGLRVAGGEGVLEAWSDAPVAERRWTELVVDADAEADTVIFTATSGKASCSEVRSLPLSSIQSGGRLVIGAPQVEPRPVSADGNGCFNGKISNPRIDAGGEVVVDVDLTDALDGWRFRERSRFGHQVELRNAPMAGATGPNWRARSSSFTEAPEEYGAVHLHDDDLEDAGWDAAASVDLPLDMPSGIYAAKLSTSDCTDFVPFFVTGPARPGVDMVLLLPTLTYLAYADEHEILSNPPSFRAFTGLGIEDADLGWRDWYSVDTGLLSLYDVHRDGSSACFASTRRPLVNVRPDYEWCLIHGPHGLAMDLRLTGWLDSAGFTYDVLTDHDLHERGADALEPYRVIVTGAHPEYWTAEMLDALEAHLDRGGRTAYLGGNGLHGVAGIDRGRPHMVEIRRGLGGSRPSSAEPGEVWLTTSREQGGTWRDRGRPSHRVLGVGTAAMGAGSGRGYVRSQRSHQAEFDWVFEGVDGDEIGAGTGFLGGPAAYEFDRTDETLGTPSHAVVLATATGFDEPYYPMLEDFMGSSPEVSDPRSPMVRADMVMMVDEAGGGAFSAGSAAWCGSLTDPNGDPTDVAVVTGNVLRRFAETPLGESPLHGGRG
ncbi:MAG: DUF6605 domain-containing protein [Solirubrobacterales bacterium]